MSHHMDRTNLPDPTTPAQAKKNYEAIMGVCGKSQGNWMPVIILLVLAVIGLIGVGLANLLHH